MNNILKFFMLGVVLFLTLPFASCQKEEKAPDLAPAFVGVYEGQIVDSTFSASGYPSKSTLSGTQLKVVYNAAVPNQVTVSAYIGSYKTFSVMATPKTAKELSVEQQSINAAFKAAGNATLTGKNIKLTLKVSDLKYILFKGTKP